MKLSGIYADGQGQLLCGIEMMSKKRFSLASCKVRTAGHTHTGISSFVTRDENLELVLDSGSWDCREWQWWEGHKYGWVCQIVCVTDYGVGTLPSKRMAN